MGALDECGREILHAAVQITLSRQVAHPVMAQAVAGIISHT